MINIISDMISCVLLNYHISCWFPAAQIRFLVIPDLPIFISRSPTLYLGCSKPLSGGIMILT
ncbi:hypothetical protein D5830_19800 [Salmonella enterica subsp. enterica serovar Weltevreden]|nr:hypothetical protein [Salmonella enterica subsp. enterica serovar Weltevreden]